ncbi:hypothetical protein BJX66DRAFT_339889 [Aspergillus keveii]|uniref:Uncharacterized protein n=1 Tax=Aspergillus keveii TaxID=714993 RepID=A0ABR4G007_9EURO
MANGHGDFGWMYGRVGEKNWGKVSEWDVPWESLVSILEIKKSDHVLMPTKEYDCPPHIIQMIQEYDLLRESQLSLLLRQERNEHADSRKWKLKVTLASCLAAERLKIEERAIGSPPLPAAAKLNCHALFSSTAVFFDYERWSVGLLIHYAKPQMVKWELRTILVQMRTLQLTRNERDRDKDVDVYGIVTSGDLIQLHKLNAASELQSSPVLLLTSQGLPTIWSYLRNIIHAIQVKAPPPLDPEKWGCEPDDPIFRVERALLTYR